MYRFALLFGAAALAHGAADRPAAPTSGTDTTPSRLVRPAARTRQDAASRDLLRLEDAWAVALVRRDGVTFRRLLAPGFVYTENDHTMDRDAVLHEVVAGSDTVRAAHNEEMLVHRFGATTSVVTGWLVTSGRGAGGAFNRRYRFTDTWVRRNGAWQIVAAHDYIAP